MTTFRFEDYRSNRWLDNPRFFPSLTSEKIHLSRWLTGDIFNNLCWFLCKYVIDSFCSLVFDHFWSKHRASTQERFEIRAARDGSWTWRLRRSKWLDFVIISETFKRDFKVKHKLTVFRLCLIVLNVQVTRWQSKFKF